MFNFVFNEKEIIKDINKVEKYLVTTVKDVAIPRYFQRLQSIAADAVQIGRIQIKLATTETGRKRAALGGDPGRIETGEFYGKLKWEAVSTGKGEYRIRIGWLDGEPEYARFQEFGFQHRSGMYVTGADALGAAQRYFEKELAKLRN